MKITEQIRPDEYESVSRKIHNILALAKDKGTTPEQKANYTAMVQRLLFKHNLRIDDLAPKVEGKKKVSNYKKVRVSVGVKHEDLKRWKQNLMEAIADNNFCRVMDGYSDHVTIIGEDENVLIVKAMYAYLEYEIRSLCRNAFKEARAKRYYSQTGTLAWKCSYREGAVDTVSERLKRQRKEDVEEANAEPVEGLLALDAPKDANGRGTALVLVKTDELLEAIYNFYPYMRPRTAEEIEAARLRQIEYDRQAAEERAKPGYKEPVYKEYKPRGRPAGSGESRYNGTAYAQGVQAGKNIRIHKEIAGSKTALNK